MSDHEPREQTLRVNTRDKRLLKAARDEIDESLALGAVARLGAKELLADDGGDTEVSF